MDYGMVALVVSVVALIVAALVPYFEYVNRGRLRTFPPRDIYFMPNPGIGLRVLMFSTAKRGHRVREMLVRVTRDGASAEFSAWRYRGELSSGAFKPYDGVDANHTFFFPHDDSKWDWLAGNHALEIIAKIDEGEEEVVLCKVYVELTDDFAPVLGGPEPRGVWFEWSRRAHEYVCFADSPEPETEG